MLNISNDYTNEEAHQKWCPVIQFSGERGQYPRKSNRPDTLDGEHGVHGQHTAHCISNHCMFWRVTEKTDKEERGYCSLVFKPKYEEEEDKLNYFQRILKALFNI